RGPRMGVGREGRHGRVRDRLADRAGGAQGPSRMKTRTAAVSAGVVAGALAVGVIGRALVRRRHPHEVEPLGPPPPEDLGPVASFDGTELAVRAAGDPDAPVARAPADSALTGWPGGPAWLTAAPASGCSAADLR